MNRYAEAFRTCKLGRAASSPQLSFFLDVQFKVGMLKVGAMPMGTATRTTQNVYVKALSSDVDWSQQSANAEKKKQ